MYLSFSEVRATQGWDPR